MAPVSLRDLLTDSFVLYLPALFRLGGIGPLDFASEDAREARVCSTPSSYEGDDTVGLHFFISLNLSSFRYAPLTVLCSLLCGPILLARTPSRQELDSLTQSFVFFWVCVTGMTALICFTKSFFEENMTEETI